MHPDGGRMLFSPVFLILLYFECFIEEIYPRAGNRERIRDRLLYYFMRNAVTNTLTAAMAQYSLS